MPFYEISPASSTKADVLDTILEYFGDDATTVNITNDLVVGDSLTILGSLHVAGDISTTPGTTHTSADDVDPTATRTWLLTGDQTISGIKTFTNSVISNGNVYGTKVGSLKFHMEDVGLYSDLISTEDTIRIIKQNTTKMEISNAAITIPQGDLKVSTGNLIAPTAMFGSVDVVPDLTPDLALTGDRAALPAQNFYFKDTTGTVVNGEFLGLTRFRGYDGGYKTGAVIRATATGDWDPLITNDAPTRIEFFCQSAGATQSITGSGDFSVSTAGVNIANHNEVDRGLFLGGTLVKASATEMNLLDGKTESNFLTTGTQTISGIKTFDSALTHTSNVLHLVRNGNCYLEVCRSAGSDSICLDFHNSDAADYTSRIVSSGGGDNVTGSGDLTTVCGVFNLQNHNGSTKGLSLNGTLITATAAEINLLDGVTSILDGAVHDLDATPDGTTRFALTNTLQTISGGKQFDSYISTPSTISQGITVLVGPTTVLLSHNSARMIIADTSGGSITIQLTDTTPQLDGCIFSVKTIHTNDCILDPINTATLEGGTGSYTIGTTYHTRTFVYCHAQTAWYFIDENGIF